VIAVSVAFGLWLLPVLVTIPWCFGNWLRYFAGVPMHNGLRDNVADFRKCVRSITLNPISEFLYWHMNWHAEHHMYGAVPCYNLKKFAHVIAYDMPKPKSLVGAWREMRATWKHQQVDPSYQFDTPVPESVVEPVAKPAAVGAAATEDRLAAGIGDLAPKALR
jgi:fatty acid desaturase